MDQIATGIGTEFWPDSPLSSPGLDPGLMLGQTPTTTSKDGSMGNRPSGDGTMDGIRASTWAQTPSLGAGTGGGSRSFPSCPPGNGTMVSTMVTARTGAPHL